ncbi:hypothetical protein SH528x_004964 [Novipirellula sp. SH528]|uniref:sialidase family protein n=1 Tax=Novipirellula sp. SH528 TaxID=3454466 RepID=UPI003F9F2751
METHTFCHVAFALALAIIGTEAGAQQEEAYDMNTPFESVLRQRTDVFASNVAGLFRADMKSGQWHKLRLPAGMPPGGRFAKVPKESDTLLYVVSDRFGRSKGEGTYGIYASRDAGEIWSLLSENCDYGPVLLLPNGSLFAVTNPTSTNGPTQVHMSKDMGKTWRNISGNSGGIFDIFPDPDHPNQICLRISSIREYILQADDERYLWNSIVRFRWSQERLCTTEFFTRNYSHSFRPPPMLTATLNNYFQYDFGDSPEILAVDLLSDDPRINVAQGEEVVIPITIRLHEDVASRQWHWENRHPNRSGGTAPTPTTMKLIDSLSSSAAWGIRVEFQGQRVAKSAKASEINSAKDRDSARQRLLSESTWTDITLTKASPFHRNLDITELHDFSAKGIYRVQLTYDDRWLAGNDSGHWLGTFTSPVFQVVVKDPSE